MSAVIETSDVRSKKARCRITTGRQALLWGDHRSTGARRYRDLVAGYAAEAGGADALTLSDRQLIARLAALTVELEAMDAERASGKPVDVECYIRGANTQARFLKVLSRLRAKKPAMPSLADYLAQRAKLSAR